MAKAKRKKRLVTTKPTTILSWWSVRAGASVAALSAAYALTPEFRELLDPKVYAWIVAGGNVLIVFLRTLNQGEQG